MNDFSGILPSDFSLKSQNKPMAARSASSRTSGGNINFDLPSRAPNTSTWSSTPVGGSLDQSYLFSSDPKSQDTGNAFDDTLGGGGGGGRSAPARRTTKSGDDAFNFDWSGGGEKSAAAAPVYDKPLYDDDIFDGVPGLKSSSSVKYEDVFSSISSLPNKSDAFDDLLGNLGRTGPDLKNSGKQGPRKEEKGVLDFEDLLPGFGSSPRDRFTVEDGQHPKTTAHAAKSSSNMTEDPFVVLESPSQPEVSSSTKSTHPSEQVSKQSSSEKIKVDNSSRSSGVFDDLDPLDGLGNFMPSNSSEMNSQSKSRSVPSTSGAQNYFGRESIQRPVRVPDSQPQRKMAEDNHMESRQAFFDIPTASQDPHKFVGPTSSPPSYVNSSPSDTKVQTDMSPQFEENLEHSDDVWLTVSEIPLFTQPTSAPPPSRPPPPRPVQISKGESDSLHSKSARKKANEFSAFPNSAQYFQSSKSAPTTARDSGVSQFDELEDFAMDKSQNNADEDRDSVSVEEVEADSAAAAMKEAMDRAEAKFRHAKEVRERENVKAARSKETGDFERDEKSIQDAQEKAFREKQGRLERERQQREREEEREQKRLEKEEIAREIERERARQAVERATREARERAATDARLKAERAAVEKANAEARVRAERTAVQRAQAEARERAALEAKARAEKAAAEARERANAEARDKEAQERAVAAARAEAEARIKAERAAVARAAAEARERAATGARERAASARANQQKNESDFESFFTMGARPSSAPRPRSNSSESPFDSQFQNKQGAEAANRTSTGVSSSIKKASSTTNIVDDLTSIFGATPSSGGFQDVEGETEERRRARLERHQRTQERAAKALAEKNERDLQTQREQAERHRIAETLDAEIKRWAAGKEGNLRALLSTMQYVLWPECGWQPVSLTDLITGASVKKVYRKATLCIHPDKVQQKGANLQQKYIAEKVFDLLKEAWNKFNSEELF